MEVTSYLTDKRILAVSGWIASPFLSKFAAGSREQI
jgi:hypothetical protein